MKKYFIYILLIVMSGLVLLTGCRWFADNPMFPTGKFEVSYKVLKEDGEEATNGILGVVSVTDIISDSAVLNTESVSAANINTTTSVEKPNWYTISIDEDGSISVNSTGSLAGGYGSISSTASITGSQESYITTIEVAFARVVEFSFSPINNVGAEIQDCEVVYTDNKGITINNLKKSLSVYLYIPPFSLNVENNEETDEGTMTGLSRTLKLEIFDQSTQDYYINHNIPFGQAIITFNGLDGAGHPIALKKAISINADMIDDSLQDEIDQQIQEIMQNQGQNPGSSCSSCS
jgi:hypothetical protein